jgi:hypothetical protein
MATHCVIAGKNVKIGLNIYIKKKELLVYGVKNRLYFNSPEFRLERRNPDKVGL